MEIHVHQIHAKDEEAVCLLRMVPLAVTASKDTVAVSVKSLVRRGYAGLIIFNFCTKINFAG